MVLTPFGNGSMTSQANGRLCRQCAGPDGREIPHGNISSRHTRSPWYGRKVRRGGARVNYGVAKTKKPEVGLGGRRQPREIMHCRFMTHNHTCPRQFVLSTFFARPKKVDGKSRLPGSRLGAGSKEREKGGEIATHGLGTSGSGTRDSGQAYAKRGQNNRNRKAGFDFPPHSASDFAFPPHW